MSETITLYKCDDCKQIIAKPTDGVVVHGNIYVADPVDRGGLVGNNFPSSGERSHTKECVAESVYCVPCFLKVVLPNTKLTQARG